jgi:hypothetical protein
VVLGIGGREFSKAAAGHGSGGNSELGFESSAVFGDTRRATVSPPDPKDDRVSPGFDFSEQLRVTQKHISTFVPQLDLDGRDVPLEPGGGFFQKVIAPAKPDIDQVNRLSLQGVEPGCQGRRPNFGRRLAPGIQNGA